MTTSNFWEKEIFPADKHPIFAGLTVFCVSLIVYLLTLCPTVNVGDSGELISCAYSLGIPHPTGYPLFCILGKIATLVLPGSTVAYKMNLFSAILGALTSGLAAGIIFVLGNNVFGAILGGLYISFLQTLWSQSVATEVYTLHVALMTGMLFFLTVYIIPSEDNKPSDKVLIAAGILFGLGCTNHVTTVTFLPAFFVAIYFGDKSVLSDFRRLMKLVLFSALPLLFYLYLPIRSMANPPNNWGNPSSLTNFWAHVTGVQYQGRLFQYGLSGWLQNIRSFGNIALNEFHAWGLTAVVLGGISLAFSRWKNFIIISSIWLINLLFYSNYRAFDVSDFFLPSHLMWGIFAGCFFSKLIEIAGKRGASRLGFGVAIVMTFFPGSLLNLNFLKVDRSDFWLAKDTGENLFRSVEPNGTVFCEGSGNLFLMEYLQICEGYRPDVKLVHRHGQIFGDFYKGIPKTQRRLAENRFILSSSLPVFYSRRRSTNGIPAFKNLTWGMLHRVIRKTIPQPKLKPEQNLAFKFLPIEPSKEDYKTREILGKYAFMRALWFLEAGKKEKARFYFREVRKVASDVFFLMGDAGKNLFKAKMFKEAEKFFKIALSNREVKFSDEFSGILVDLGRTQLRLKKLDEAAKSLNFSLRLNDRNGLAHFELSVLELKRKNLAIAEREATIALQLKFKGANELLRFIQSKKMKGF